MTFAIRWRAIAAALVVGTLLWGAVDCDGRTGGRYVGYSDVR